MSEIQAEGLSRRFGERVAVRDLSLGVAAGEIYGLIGPDGAGKTTTLRLLAGLLDRDSGTVCLSGSDPLDPRGTSRERLGYMPQQYSLYGDLTVAENLAFFREMYGLTRSAFGVRRERLLALTRLADFRDRRAEALSGGMYKKLALACALLHEPRALLLDEPTTGVDPLSRRELWDLLDEFLAEGMAIVIATPYMDEAARCHRAGMLHRGALLVEGTPRELLAAFRDLVFVVHGRRDSLDDELEQDPAVLACTPMGDGLRVVVHAGGEAGVLARLEAMGARVDRAAASFEDLFLARMREAAPS